MLDDLHMSTASHISFEYEYLKPNYFVLFLSQPETST